MPVAFDEGGLHGIGYSNEYAGGYGELIVLNELLAIKVPHGLGADVAALTEPFAVGVHAVAKSRITSGESAIVLGLGPVGLAVVAELKRRGIGPIVAADYSSTRRQLAELMGADVVVDPNDTPAIAAWRTTDGVHPVVIFEAVGVPGMIDQAMRMASKNSRILVVGACMQADSIHPMVALTKELGIQFAFGYDPIEFSASLQAIAEGVVDLAPWLTGRVGIDGVPQAFNDLTNPEQHAKILVVP
jgi:threonine dehydrogenase-like Zn-dependent dehydrogenase